MSSITSRPRPAVPPTGKLRLAIPPQPPAGASEQVLAVGKPIDSKYAATVLGGFRDCYMSVAPEHALMVAAGRAGRGKSSFFQSCHRAFIINGDLSSTPRKVKATIWPGLRRDGTVVEPDPSADDPTDPEQGRPIAFSYQLVKDKQAQLIQLAKDDQPRPGLIVWDTVDLTVPAIQAWFVEDWNRRYPENPKETFDDLDGRDYWPALYQEVVRFGLDLHTAGYGFAWVFHLGDKTQQHGSERLYLTNEPLVQGNLWNRVLAHAELIAVFNQVVETRNLSKPVLDVNGKQKLHGGKGVTKTVAVKRRIVRMELAPTEASPDAKKRYASMPDHLDLDQSVEAPWLTYEKAALAAMAKEGGV